MSETNQIAGLETALLERASKLAEEYRVNGRQQHDRMLADANKRLHDDEERAVLAAKTQAERTYQQQVQAAELQLRAEIDRLRLDLVNAVLSHLPARLEQLVADEQRYLTLLRTWLGEGAQAIERDELIVQLNARDLQRLHKDWNKLAVAAVPNKRLTLADEPIACRGGILITSADHNIRVDNTFEGRHERLAELLQNVVAEQLVPATAKGGN